VSYDDELLDALKSELLHPFAHFHEIGDLPRIGAGDYTTWEAEPERSERLARRPAGADTSPHALFLLLCDLDLGVAVRLLDELPATGPAERPDHERHRKGDVPRGDGELLAERVCRGGRQFSPGTCRPPEGGRHAPPGVLNDC
jgi:hypothetical protein